MTLNVHIIIIYTTVTVMYAQVPIMYIMYMYVHAQIHQILMGGVEPLNYVTN